MTDKPNTDWPSGVIARYLTVGGATVDLTEDHAGITATCLGCPNTSRMCDADPTGTGNRNYDRATRQAAQWAQTHAEKCRAMPKSQASKPGAT